MSLLFSSPLLLCRPSIKNICNPSLSWSIPLKCLIGLSLCPITNRVCSLHYLQSTQRKGKRKDTGIKKVPVRVSWEYNKTQNGFGFFKIYYLIKCNFLLAIGHKREVLFKLKIPLSRTSPVKNWFLYHPVDRFEDRSPGLSDRRPDGRTGLVPMEPVVVQLEHVETRVRQGKKETGLP